MATQLVYLEDFGVVTCSAKVAAAEQTEDERTDIQLDQTCFYPRGGGQDWDTGTIKSVDGSAVFAVQEVRLDENGVVHHIGAFQSGELKPDEEVACAVDTERRTINTRLHSAGHVVDLVVDRLKLPLVPGRGGTHVADLHDIGKITITKVKTKKGLTKVSYAVEGING